MASARPTPAALAETRHDAASAPEIGEAAHRTDEWVSVWCEGEGAVDDLLYAGILERRKMFETQFERRRDAIDVRGEQIVSEIPRRLGLGPWDAGFLISPHQHAAALLPQVQFTIKIDGVQHLSALGLVEGGNLGHVFSQEIHVLHRQYR